MLRHKSNRTSIAGLLAGVTLLSVSASMASSHEDETASAETIRALEERVTQLEERLEELELLKPNFGSFMPQFAERFHVLHLAGDAGDWKVAKHELLQMQHLVKVSQAVDAERGQMFKRFMSGMLDEINAAIDHEERDRFASALEQTVQNCNACHRASGSSFIRVTLDVPSDLSMRHAHVLRKSSVEGMDHTHEH